MENQRSTQYNYEGVWMQVDALKALFGGASITRNILLGASKGLMHCWCGLMLQRHQSFALNFLYMNIWHICSVSTSVQRVQLSLIFTNCPNDRSNKGQVSFPRWLLEDEPQREMFSLSCLAGMNETATAVSGRSTNCKMSHSNLFAFSSRHLGGEIWSAFNYQ